MLLCFAIFFSAAHSARLWFLGCSCLLLNCNPALQATPDAPEADVERWLRMTLKMLLMLQSSRASSQVRAGSQLPDEG